MANLFQTLATVLKWVAIVLGSMFAIGLAAHMLYPSDWRPVEAVVTSSKIAESRGRGNESWVIAVDADYEVAGRPHQTKNLYAVRKTYLADVEAETRHWQPGSRFTLYVNAENPDSVSIHADGGREAIVVVAVIATPLIVGLLAPFLIAWRRRRANTAAAAP